MPLDQQGANSTANIATYNDIVGPQNIYYQTNGTLGHYPEISPAQHLILAPWIDLRALLQPAEYAAYDCGPRAMERCHDGTRVAIVNSINEWVLPAVQYAG